MTLNSAVPTRGFLAFPCVSLTLLGLARAPLVE
jgi:hypothetical protein